MQTRLKSVSVLQAKVFGDPTKMRPVLLSSTLATTLKPAKGTTITRAGAMPASDVQASAPCIDLKTGALRETSQTQPGGSLAFVATRSA